MIWPFRKKLAQPSLAFWITEPLPGIQRLSDGNLEITLTKGEEETVERHLMMLREFAMEESGGIEVKVHPEAAIVFEAQGLWLYAHHILVRSLRSESDADAGVDSAIAALTKAYALCRYPVILADLARAYRVKGDAKMENDLNNEFSERNSTFQTNQLCESFLTWREGLLNPRAEDRRN